MIEDLKLQPNEKYNGSPFLKKAGVQLHFSEDHIREIIKCKNDVIYFVQNYVKIISMDEGLVKFDVYGFQERMLRNFTGQRHNICLLPRQMGKCVSGDTQITVKNKKTGKIETIDINKFYDRVSR